MKKDTISLDKRKDLKLFGKAAFMLVVPMALQNLINVGVQSADVIMLGRVNETVLSASSLAGQVQFVMTLVFFGFSSGATVLTAQYWGKGDTRTIEKVIAIALRLSAAIALLFTLAAFFIPATLMRIFSPDPDIIREGVTYLRIVALSYLFMAFSNTYLNIMRSVEKVLISTVVYFVSLLVNIILNSIFIFGMFGAPAMGIAGAAIGTISARFVELIIVAVYAARNPVIRLRKKDYVTLNKTLFKDFLKYATPTTINEVLWGLAIAANSVVIGHMGSAAVAANSVAQVARQLATVISFGIANATAIMVGKAIGGGETLKAQRYASRFIRLTLVTGTVGGAIILGIRPFLINVMKLTPVAEKYLGFLLLWMSIFVIAQAYNTTMVVGVFRGGGDTKFGLFMDMSVMWGLCIPLGAAAAFLFNVPVQFVYMILMADEFIKLPLTTIRYKRKKWLRNVTRDNLDT